MCVTGRMAGDGATLDPLECIRLLPAINIADEQIDEGCDIFDDVLMQLKP